MSRHDELSTFGAFLLITIMEFLAAWGLMLLVGVLHAANNWPTFTLCYWHSFFVVFVFYPVFGMRRMGWREA